MQGQKKMGKPLSGGGQTFQGGLGDFLKYMMTSTPGQQAIKQQLSGLDDSGGTLEEGERSLFTRLAPYLTADSTKPPTGATPFTDWDPLSLLQTLLKTGILSRPK